MPKLLIAGLTLLILSGCRCPTIALSPQDSTTICGKKVNMSKYARPDFSAVTSGKALVASLTGVGGALLMGAASIDAGNRLVQENDVEDPAYNIAKELGKHLEGRYGVLVNSRTPAVCSKDSLNMLINTYGNGDLILDVRTLNWSILYYASDWNDYRVIYSARVRLIDTKSKRVLAQAVCTRKYSDEELSYEDLTGNAARGLKDQLLKASRYCVDCFLSKAFPETDPS